MKKLLYMLIFGFLIFNFNPNTINQSVFAKDNTEATTEATNEAPTEIPEASLQTDDVLDKPIFNDKQPVKKVNKVTSKLSSFIVKTLGFILLSFVAIICLLFIVIANKQRQVEKRRKRMSANTNVVNAVDNFAHHRIRN